MTRETVERWIAAYVAAWRAPGTDIGHGLHKS